MFDVITENQQVITDADRRLKNPQTPAPERQKLEEKKSEALGKITEIADSVPKDAGVQARALGAFMQVNEPKRAMPIADRVVSLAPNNPQAYVLRGQVKRAMNDFAGAEADAERALKLDPNNKQAQNLFALTHGRGGYRGSGGAAGAGGSPPAGASALGAGRHAAPTPERAAAGPGAFAPAQAPPASPPAIVAAAAANVDRLKAFELFKQAQAKSKLGDEAAAKALLDKAAAADPANPQVLVSRASSRVRLGDAEGAFADADAALMLDGKNGRAYLARGAAREALGHTPEAALRDYKLAAELDPDLGGEYQAALARLSRTAAEPAPGGKPAEHLVSGRLPPLAKKAWPIALIALGVAVFGGAALKLKRDSEAP